MTTAKNPPTTVNEAMYREFAKHYDRIYSYKDTVKEVRFILAAMRQRGIKGKDVLDVACGTGRHAKLLAGMGYHVVAIDKNEGMLRIARKKVPTAEFIRGDMQTFRLPSRFDAILCMFTSLNYSTRKKDLVSTLRNLRTHLNDSGMVVFDTPLRKRGKAERTTGEILDGDTAVLYSWRERGDLTIGDLYWIIRKPRRGGKTTHVVQDRHVLRMYRLSEIREALKAAGLESRVCWDFSFSKKQGRRPVFVCWRARTPNARP